MIATLKYDNGTWRYPMIYIACLFGVSITTVSNSIERAGGVRRGRYGSVVGHWNVKPGQYVHSKGL